MKKQVLTLALLLALALAGRGQSYYPMSDNCLWSVSNDKYVTAGDTLIGGQIYLKIYRQSGVQSFNFDLSQAQYFGAIRNDSVGKRVYGYLPAGTWIRALNSYAEYQTDTDREVLLYDFSLEYGDTVTYYAIGNSHCAVECTAICSETVDIPVGWSQYSAIYHHYADSDSLVYLTDNTALRQFFLTGIGNYSPNNVWIEGVGGIHGFGEGDHLWYQDASTQMVLCFTNRFGASYHTAFDFDNNPEDCFSNGFGGDVTEKPRLKVSLFPNPVTNTLHIKTTPSARQLTKVQIYNGTGNCVFANSLSSMEVENAIDVSSLPQGVYFIKLFSQTNCFTVKFVKL